MIRFKSQQFLFVVLISLAPFQAVFAEQGGLGLHKRIYVMPRAKPVVIDGKLDDWDLSGQIWMYVTQETSEMQSAKFAMMFDAEALYLCAEVRDPSPMMNRHDPSVDAEKAWDADACQFRIVLDPKQGYPVDESSYGTKHNDQMAHTLLWYYTDRKEPCLQLRYGMKYDLPKAGYRDGVVPRDKFEAAYRLAEDNRGYAFEYRIPWTTLEAKNPPKGGEFVAATVQFNWSRSDGLHTAGGSAWAYDVMAGPGFTYQSSGCWGKAIFAKENNLPPELREEGVPPAPPLPLTFEYDLPSDGDVTVQLYDQQNQMMRLLVAQGARRAGKVIERWDGLDDAGKPLPPGAYTWRGLYHQPITTKHLLSLHNSGQPPYKTDDNTGGWGGDHGTPQAVCAVGDFMLASWYASEAGWGIIRTDLTGKKQWGCAQNAAHLASDGTRIFYAGGYAARGVASLSLADSRPLNFGRGSITLEEPAGGDEASNAVTGLAFANGTLYVAHAKRNLITLYDPEKGTIKESWKVPAPERFTVRADRSLAVISAGKVLVATKDKAASFITDHLDEPVSIATDSDGLVYVANRGSLQNVSIFSADGKYLRSIGKPGGRPLKGRYDRNGMLAPGGITIDRLNHLWVAETLDSPKRISVWDARSSEFVKEFFGGSSYSPFVCADPKHEGEFYCHNVLWKVDLDKGTSEPVSTIWRSTSPNMVHAPDAPGYMGHFRVITARNGKQFGWGMHDAGHILYRRDSDLFKPIAGAIRLYHHSPYTAGAAYSSMKDEEKFPDGIYLWQDGNDDQQVQEAEISPTTLGHSEVLFNWIDADLNIWNDAGFLFRPLRVAPGGRPVYDFTKREPIPFQGGHCNFTSLWLDPQNDTVYTLAPGSNEGFRHATRDGKTLWSFRGVVDWPHSVSLPPVRPGKFWGATMPLGVAGDYTGVATYFGTFQIVTRDGLFVAMLFKDQRLGGTGPEVIGCENFTGQLVRMENSGRYLLLSGDQDGRVTEVIGLDSVKRLPGGTFTLSEAETKTAAAAQADYQKRKSQSQPLVVVRGKSSLESAKGVTKTLDDGRAFTAKVAYDEHNLYVAYDVDSRSELVNAASDPHLIFKGGNLLDIQLTTEAGDQRLLVSRQAGKPVAVLFRPKVKGFTGQPIVLTSPTGKESFDAIEPVPSVSLEYAKTASGFKAVATIPLDVIGWKPAPGKTVKIDLGYIFGNATGTQAALRSYWSNTSFSAGVVNDVPNESRLEPAQWGVASVE